jgi:mRNA-degrading endonuclease YafQ of YafQ-DinJ toxin-antitoxin module
MYSIVFTESYIKRAKKFFSKNPEVIPQYEKALKLLQLNPAHPSLRLHKLRGKLSKLFSVSINITYRITVLLIIKDKKIIPVDIGKHEHVY